MARRNKNRKKQSAGFIFPAPFAAALTLAAVLALSYLWLCGRCESLGVQIKALEAKKTDLHNRVINEEYKWSNLKSPRNIELFLQQHNLVMTWPDESRIIRVRTGQGSRVAESGHHQYAQNNGAAVND